VRPSLRWVLIALELGLETGKTAPYTAPIRNSVVPHFGHLPFIAGFPFLSFTFFGSAISRFARHFTQYAWTMGDSPIPADGCRAG